MNFLRKTLQKNERPICRSHLHFIYLVSGFLWFTGLAAIGWVSDYYLWVHLGEYIPTYEINNQYIRFGLEPGLIGWLFTAGGTYILLGEIINFISTHVVVTNQRLVYKTGFIRVRVGVTEINDILGANVDQGWFGQFFGYGKLHLDCRFIEDVYIPYVKNPYGIVHAIHKVRQNQTEGHAPVRASESAQPASQPVIQILGNNPVYIIDHVPPDPKTPLRQLPKSVGENMKNAFRRKA